MTDIIDEKTLKRFVASLAPDMRIAGPVRDGKTVEYREAPADEFILDDSISYKSPKEFYFPQVEKLITFRNNEAVSEPDPKPVVILGARPCDIEALRVMREVFLEGRYKDPFFERRMERNIIIGLACDAKKPGCFCDALGLGMKFSDFCDVMLERVPEKANGAEFKVTYLSEKGARAFANFPATADVKPSAVNFPQKHSRVMELDTERDEKDYFAKIGWEEITMACQGCGMCTFICPTCHCFEFKDVSEEEITCRYRCWDSCMFPRFTLHASGHNPRASRAGRYRQRALHKYLYVPQNTGYIACTGCGRCVRSCPAGINIKSIIESLMETGK